MVQFLWLVAAVCASQRLRALGKVRLTAGTRFRYALLLPLPALGGHPSVAAGCSWSACKPDSMAARGRLPPPHPRVWAAPLGLRRYSGAGDDGVRRPAWFQLARCVFDWSFQKLL